MRGSLWLLIVTVACAVIVILAFRSGEEPAPTGVETATPGPDAVAAVPPPPEEPVPVIPPPVVEAPEPDPPLLVDSFPSGAQPRLENWAVVSDLGGHLDVVTLRDTGAALTDANALKAENVIVAQGWAGDAGLGIRYFDVLLSMCGQFVARAQVDGERPDVASVVHPNLLKSGWTADIFAGDLPSCANPELQAWAVVPGRQAALASLVGKRRINVEQSTTVETDRVSSQVPINPFQYWPYKNATIDVTASRANMRRCGSTDCAVVAKIDRGTYPAAVLDQRDGWTLLIFEKQAGWLFDELFDVVP